MGKDLFLNRPCRLILTPLQWYGNKMKLSCHLAATDFKELCYVNLSSGLLLLYCVSKEVIQFVQFSPHPTTLTLSLCSAD